MAAEFTPKQDVSLTMHRKEMNFPATVEGRMEAVLSSVNASPKAALLLLLTPSITSADDLKTGFRKLYAGHEISKRNDQAVDYCRSSLCDVGLVAEEYTLDYYGHEKNIGFAITPAGKKYGQPWAAYDLQFEAENGFSVYPVLGQTQLASGEHRSPLNRAKIIKALAGGTKREVDLSEELGLNHERIRSSLNALEKAGVVTNPSVKPQTGKEQVYYELNPEFTPDQNTNPSPIVSAVLEAANKVTLKGVQITQKSVYDVLPVQFKKGRKEKNVRTYVSRALSHLADQQNALLRGRYKGRNTSSFPELTEKGRVILEKYINILEDAMSDGPSLDKISSLSARITPILPEYARATIDLYYPYSRSYSSLNSESTATRISELLNSTGKTTVQDVAEQAQIGEWNSRKVLISLIDRGQATRKKVNGVYYYFPLSQTEQTGS